MFDPSNIQSDCISNSYVYHMTFTMCRKQPTEGSEVAGSSTADIATTQCEAYKQARLGQEYEVDPKPEYDVILAFEGGQQKHRQQDYKNITAQPPVPALQETSGRLED